MIVEVRSHCWVIVEVRPHRRKIVEVRSHCWVIVEVRPYCWVFVEVRPYCWVIVGLRPHCWVVVEVRPHCWVIFEVRPDCWVIVEVRPHYWKKLINFFLYISHAITLSTWKALNRLIDYIYSLFIRQISIMHSAIAPNLKLVPCIDKKTFWPLKLRVFFAITFLIQSEVRLSLKWFYTIYPNFLDIKCDVIGLIWMGFSESSIYSW